MITKFRPLLACSITEQDLDNIIYPVACQPKIDGIRCILLNGKAVTRTLKPIPNKYIRKYLEQWSLSYKNFSVIDGEITSNKTFQETTSIVMTHDTRPENWTYNIFDLVEDDFSDNFTRRFSHTIQSEIFGDHISILTTVPAIDKNLVLKLEDKLVKQPPYYEGLILRSLRAPYKFGRSTFNEQYLMKLKRFKDSEAVIVDFEQKFMNDNTPTINALGYMERGHSIVNRIPAHTLGALVVRDLVTQKEFNVGSGFTDTQRHEIWENRAKFRGKIIKYKYQEIGMKELPRTPVFLGFRKD